MANSPFHMDHTPIVGQAVDICDRIRVITAPNASPMTFTGTQTYVLGRGSVAVIDPGPKNEAHLDAIIRAVEGERVEAILVTHAHVDHSPLARELKRRVDAPIYGAKLDAVARAEGVGGGEGIDFDFVPDVPVFDGSMIEGVGWGAEVIGTPGHLSNHISFACGEYLFSGDHVMGWATTMISPPEGNLTDFMGSLEKLQGRSEQTYLPGHGAPIHNPQEIIAYIHAHRNGRKDQIVNVLSDKPQSVPEITRAIYTDVDPKLHGAASRNVLAHVIDLIETGHARSDGKPLDVAVFQLI